jgi:hypothetical protein
MTAPPPALRLGRAGCVVILGFFAGAMAAQDARWLHDNDKKNRYEGLLDQPNAKRAYDILGFFGFDRNREPIPLEGRDVNLHVSYCLPEPDAVFIEARQMRGRTQYLMKSKDAEHIKGWNDFRPWPVSEVLSRHAIHPDDLGVIVRLKLDNEYTEELAPAVFYANQPPARINQYSLSMTVRQKLANLSYDFVAGGRKRECNYTPATPCSPGRVAGDTSLEAGGTVTMPLDFTGIPAGPATIHVRGMYANSDETLFAQYHFYHYPAYPECK